MCANTMSELYSLDYSYILAYFVSIRGNNVWRQLQFVFTRPDVLFSATLLTETKMRVRCLQFAVIKIMCFTF